MSQRELSHIEQRTIGNSLWERFGADDELCDNHPDEYDRICDEYSWIVCILGELIHTCFRQQNSNFEMLHRLIEARVHLDCAKLGLNPEMRYTRNKE